MGLAPVGIVGLLAAAVVVFHRWQSAVATDDDGMEREVTRRRPL